MTPVTTQAETGKKKRDIRWYLYLHKNADANEIIAKALNTGPDFEDRLRRGVICSDFKPRDLWAVTYDEKLLGESASRSFNFKLTVFTQEGEGTVRVFVDPNIKRHKNVLRSKVKKAGK